MNFRNCTNQPFINSHWILLKVRKKTVLRSWYHILRKQYGNISLAQHVSHNDSFWSADKRMLKQDPLLTILCPFNNQTLEVYFKAQDKSCIFWRITSHLLDIVLVVWIDSITDTVLLLKMSHPLLSARKVVMSILAKSFVNAFTIYWTSRLQN